MTPEAIARCALDVTRIVCFYVGDPLPPAWEVQPPQARAGRIKAVEAVLADPTLTGAGLHERWVADYRARGYVYGERTDHTATPPTHVDLVPADQRSPSGQVKGEIFVHLVRDLSKLGVSA